MNAQFDLEARLYELIDGDRLPSLLRLADLLHDATVEEIESVPMPAPEGRA